MPTRLTPALKNYEWGDITALPDFTGQLRDAKPWAELWFGTHPDGQATIQTGNGTNNLSEIVGELSFLVKLIAVAKPLSIQTHPTIAQAQTGFARENALGIDRAEFKRVYRDENSKPELLCALSDFKMLCGFAPIDVSLARAENYGWLELARHLKLTGLANTVRWALEEKNHKTPRNLPQYLQIVGELYADTGGLYVALLMNHISLQSGQAMFLEPGNVHSYLSGMAVEVMSSSDNVMRAAFTTKHVDLKEFFATAVLDTLLPQLVAQLESSTDVIDYDLANAPFSVQKISVNNAITIQAENEVELYLCVQGQSGDLQQGQACVLRKHEVLRLTGPSTVFRVWGA